VVAYSVTRVLCCTLVQEAFYRQDLPNIMSLLSTVAVFCMVVYFQVGEGFHIVAQRLLLQLCCK
jgi:hypothetical protein